MLLAVVFVLSVLLVPLSRAQDQDENADMASHARIVRLSHIEGTVQLDNDNGYENATANMPVAEGDRLLTRSDGWAEVQFEDGSTLRLSPDTQASFSQLGLNSEGGTVTAVDLDEGEAELNLKKHDNGEFALTVRNKTLLLKHSGRFRVTTTNSTPLEVAVWKGAVGVDDAASGSEIAVKKNETFTLDAMDLGRYDLEKDVEADDLDQWSQQRDETLSSYASAGNGSYAQSPYQYGLNDLNQYGSYYDVPGYGYLWQPSGVSLGWDPFMNGYWTYSPIYGYSWVSAYPWGWMPYRYGQWVLVNGRGWMWQPGNWQGWWRRPRVVNAPAGFHPPAPPATRFTRRSPEPVRAGTLPARVNRTNPSAPATFHGGTEQVPRVEAGRDRNGRRVFTNEDSPGEAPRVGDRRPQPDEPRVNRGPVEANTQPKQIERQPRPEIQPAQTRPAEVPRQPERQARPDVRPAETRPAQAPFQPGRGFTPPAVRSGPAPSAPPAPRINRPAQAPRVSTPPPAPHMSAPAAAAPRISSPPPAPRASTPPSNSRPDASDRSPRRPR